MFNFLLAFSTYVFLFILLWVSVRVGYGFGIRQYTPTTNGQIAIVKVAEGTVFALLGLLVAFSFSGAYDRYENRKLKIMEEVNAIDTAYRRIDLLAPNQQSMMRGVIKHYVDSRLETYKKLTEYSGFDEEYEEINKEHDKLWLSTMAAVKATNNEATTLLFVNAIDDMLGIADTRILLTRVHPPVQIFILLIGLASLSSFLAGYSMAKNKTYSAVYTLCFVAITAFTLYVIIDLEFPRIGMIRVDGFDRFIAEMRDSLR